MGCALTGCLLLGTRGGRRLRAPTPPGGPLGFLESLSDPELRLCFAGERAPVVAAALGQLPVRAQRRLRRALALPAELKSPAPAPPPELLDAMARALRAKLEDRQEFGA